jgi:hypothetical protein
MTAIANTATATTVKNAKAKAPLATKIGRGITAFVVLFLVFDAVMHLSNPDFVAQSFQQQGFPAYAPLVTGLLEVGCLVLYLVPRTAMLGALFQTAYLGGAFCANLRIDAPLFSSMLFPVYIGILVWAGLYLRNAAVRKALGVDILAKRR